MMTGRNNCGSVTIYIKLGIMTLANFEIIFKSDNDTYLLC